ncbi:hypothetical protein LCGC14_3097940, partial [marine sediment metagenome]
LEYDEEDYCRRIGAWPARPGQEQYDWEEPRTVESGMGPTVNGTPVKLDATTHRVDRLRLKGASQ